MLRDAHDEAGPALFNARWALSLLRGPMTKAELQRARAVDDERVSRAEAVTRAAE